MALTEEKVREALTAVVDPELGFNIVDLGLVYDVAIEGDTVTVTMTLTSMACPLGPQIVQEAREAVEKLEGVSHANINVVFSPPWHPDMMREEIRWLFGR
ncbi:MAG: aromatic ring hydroxylase [Firmicutes bacterium]|nr:aromatic ring hydroxylase [Bacillota bacterium]MBO2521544.1 aromatic ring hydroxylase [Bacillota bacterium]